MSTPIHWQDPAEVDCVHVAKGDAVAFRACVARAREIRCLRAFASDLTVHDRGTLAANPVGRRFLWTLGESGTTLIWVDAPGYRQPEAVARWLRENGCTLRGARSLVASLAESRPHMFVWDGVSLQPCDADRAVALLVGEENEP